MNLSNVTKWFLYSICMIWIITVIIAFTGYNMPRSLEIIFFGVMLPIVSIILLILIIHGFISNNKVLRKEEERFNLMYKVGTHDHWQDQKWAIGNKDADAWTYCYVCFDKKEDAIEYVKLLGDPSINAVGFLNKVKIQDVAEYIGAYATQGDLEEQLWCEYGGEDPIVEWSDQDIKDLEEILIDFLTNRDILQEWYRIEEIEVVKNVNR